MSEVLTVEVSDVVARKLTQAAAVRQLDMNGMLASALEWFVERETGPLTATEEEELARATEVLGLKDAVAAVRARRLGMPEGEIEAIKEGLKDVRAGRLIPHEEVAAKLAARYGW